MKGVLRSKAVGPTVFVLLVLFAVAAGTIQAAAATGGKLPDFRLERVDAPGSVASADFQGKVLLVNFWATWCPPCRQEIPSLIRLQDLFRDRGFVVLGLSVDQDGREVVARFIAKMKTNYPVALATSDVGRAFGFVLGIPTSFLVNRNGDMVKTYTGYVSEAQLRKDVEPLL